MGSTRKRVKDVNELRERLVEVWAGLQQNVIDDAIDQWRRRLHACVRAIEEDKLSSLFVVTAF